MQLVATALRLFLERGYVETTIDDIAEASDVSPRTFFRYFATKDDVVAAGPLDLGRGLDAFVADAPPDESPLRIALGALRLVAIQYQAWPESLALGRMILATPELRRRLAVMRDQLARDIANALARRSGSESAHAHFEARVIAGATQPLLSAAFERWVAEDGIHPLPDLIDEAFAIAARAHAHEAAFAEAPPLASA